MINIRERLFSLQDREYGQFHARLIPATSENRIIGVRVPMLRKLAKEIEKAPEQKEFLRQLPHLYNDENMLHAILISDIRNYSECIDELERFLPFIDNWAVCDTISPKIFKKEKTDLIDRIRVWASSGEVYTCRIGLEMLMKYYLDEDFKEEYLEIPASVHSGEYYVNMMIAWFFATALAKQWDAAIPYLEQRRLSVWVHNKTIQKACESYRISDVRKAYLKNFKVKE